MTLQRSCDRVHKFSSRTRRCYPPTGGTAPQPSTAVGDMEGAVIFGKSEAFPWRWPDTGEPQSETTGSSQSTAGSATATEPSTDINSGIWSSSGLQSPSSASAPASQLATEISVSSSTAEPPPETAKVVIVADPGPCRGRGRGGGGTPSKEADFEAVAREYAETEASAEDVWVRGGCYVRYLRR